MDAQIVSWVMNALLGIAAYFLKQEATRVKVDIDKLEAAIDALKETKMSKGDFSEFKQELWKRLDRFELALEKK